jgi:hypothetical protein
MFPLTKGVNKQSFKCGSLDQLMKLNDDFQKMELQVDGACKRVEKQYFDLCAEMNVEPAVKVKMLTGQGNQHKDVSVQEYLADFKWDGVHFQQEKNLEFLGHFIQKKVKGAEEKVKQNNDKMNQLKTHLSSLTKKKGANMTQSDLADFVYENRNTIKAQQFVNTHYQKDEPQMMTTMLVVVNQKKEQQFRESYESILISFNESDMESWTKKARANLHNDMWEKVEKEEIDKAKKAADERPEDAEGKKPAPVMPTRDQLELIIKPMVDETLEQLVQTRKKEIYVKPGAVPKSLTDLKVGDADGNQLYAVVCIREDIGDYMKVVRK